MITIVNKRTGQIIKRYSHANVCESSVNTFVIDCSKWEFIKPQWEGIVDSLFYEGRHRLLCKLTPTLAIKECLK